jgi:hypothetical protein
LIFFLCLRQGASRLFALAFLSKAEKGTRKAKTKRAKFYFKASQFSVFKHKLKRNICINKLQ